MKEQIQKRVSQIIHATAIAIPIEKLHFPSIPLIIPDTFRTNPVAAFLTSRMFLFNFMVGFLLMTMVIVWQDIQLNNARLETIHLQRQMVVKKINQWQAVVGQYPGYRDGYYQLALLEKQLGNNQLAYGYIVKALQMDPDFTTGKEFLETLVQ
jgi:hypothetical protein